MSKLISSLLLAVIVILGGCCKSESKNEKQVNAVPIANIEDSAQSRASAAQNVIKIYPMSEWSEDILERVRKEAGSEVTANFEKTVRERLSYARIQEIRIQVLVENFTANELQAMATLMSDPSGKSMWRKVPIYDQKIRELVTPILMESLSGNNNG